MRELFFAQRLLRALNIDGVRAFFRLLYFVSDFVTFVKIIELDAYQAIAVEEQILFLTFGRDKSETLVGQFFDCTFHGCIEMNKSVIDIVFN